MYLVWFEEPKQPLWQIQNIFVFEHLLYHQRFSALLSENHRLELHVDLGQHGLNTLPLQKHNPTLKINFKSNIMNIKYLIILSDMIYSTNENSSAENHLCYLFRSTSRFGLVTFSATFLKKVFSLIIKVDSALTTKTNISASMQ